MIRLDLKEEAADKIRQMHYKVDIDDYVSQVKSLNEDPGMNGTALHNAVLNWLPEYVCLYISLFV